MNQNKLSNFNGVKRGEMQVLCSPTGRDKTLLSVNLPGSKECFGAPLPSIDFSALELKVEALMATQCASQGIKKELWPNPELSFRDVMKNVERDLNKGVASLMNSADRMIGFERTVATPGQTFQMFNSRTGNKTTYELKDSGDWEEVD